MARGKVLTPGFTDFWRAYGIAYGSHPARLAAARAWNRMSGRDKRAAYKGIDGYREQCRNTGVAMKQAPGYLSDRRWEDAAVSEDEKQEVQAGELPDEMELW